MTNEGVPGVQACCQAGDRDDRWLIGARAGLTAEDEHLVDARVVGGGAAGAFRWAGRRAQLGP
jgi:hypothetical protein